MKEIEQPSKDPKSFTEELKSAVQNLETFVIHNDTNATPNVWRLSSKNQQLLASPQSGFKKLISLIHAFIIATFSNQQHERNLMQRNEVQKTLLNSIRFISSHFLSIQQLHLGNQEEKVLANYVVETIKRYREMILKAGHSPPSFSKWATRFFYKQCGFFLEKTFLATSVPLPTPITAKVTTKTVATSEKIKALPEEAPSLSPEETDAFRMKVIQLLKQEGVPHQEIEKVLQENPNVHIKIQEIDPQISKISIKQILKLPQGTTLELKGAFKRLTQQEGPSIPIPESFRCSEKKTKC